MLDAEHLVVDRDLVRHGPLNHLLDHRVPDLWSVACGCGPQDSPMRHSPHDRLVNLVNRLQAVVIFVECLQPKLNGHLDGVLEEAPEGDVCLVRKKSQSKPSLSSGPNRTVIASSLVSFSTPSKVSLGDSFGYPTRALAS